MGRRDGCTARHIAICRREGTGCGRAGVSCFGTEGLSFGVTARVPYFVKCDVSGVSNERTNDISVIGDGEDGKFVPRISGLLKDTLGVMQFGIIPPIEFALRLTWSSDEKNKKD